MKLTERQKERGEFVAQLWKEFPNRRLAEILVIADELMRIARRLHALDLKQCNDSSWSNMDDTENHYWMERAKETCTELGLKCEFGEVRGFALKLYLPSGRYNSWDGLTWGVPQE